MKPYRITIEYWPWYTANQAMALAAVLHRGFVARMGRKKNEQPRLARALGMMGRWPEWEGEG